LGECVEKSWSVFRKKETTGIPRAEEILREIALRNACGESGFLVFL
jgi:hypothetical protein